MLFTDSLIVTTADLVAYESEIPDIADVQNISLPTVISQAQQETGEKFLELGGRLMGRVQPVFMPVDYGVQSLYTEAAVRPRFSLGQVVITDADYPSIATAAKNYAVAHTLYNFYRNAARRQRSEDRYSDARDEWQTEANAYLVRLKKAGMPIVGRPMPRPAAEFEWNSGTWGVENVIPTSSDGVMLAESGQFDIAVSYYDSGYGAIQDDPAIPTANNESALSEIVTVSLDAGYLAALDITSLNPPNGRYRPAAIARIAINTLTADRWNVYAAPTGQPLTLQTPGGLAIADKTFLLDCGSLVKGRLAGPGQSADMYFELLNVISRG